MRKLKVNTSKIVEESHGLIKVDSNQTHMSQFPKFKILEIIDNAKKFEKGIDALRKIAENYKKKEYHTKPGKFAKQISSIGETAYQRAIFLSEKTHLISVGEIVWNDLELPVVFNESSKRRCVDLVGTLNNKTSVLCELKFNSTQSPIYAAIELLIYYYLIKDNCEELDEKKVFHKNGKPFQWKAFNDNPILIVGANKTYWNDWQKSYEKRMSDIESWRNSLPLIIRFFSSADFDFEEQKRTQKTKTYQPSVSDKVEWEEVYL